MPRLVPELARVVEIEFPRLVSALEDERRHHFGNVHLQRALAEKRKVALVGWNVRIVVDYVRWKLEVVETLEARVTARREVGLEGLARARRRKRSFHVSNSHPAPVVAFGVRDMRITSDAASGVQISLEVVLPQ